MVNLKAVRRITRTGLTLSDVELSIVIGNLLDNATGWPPAASATKFWCSTRDRSPSTARMKRCWRRFAGN